MFPCWDEPSFKATFAISMGTKEGLKCLSCMPEAAEPSASQVDLASAFVGDDWQTVHFDLTPAMSTYLVAIASGPFNCLSDSYVSKITGNTVQLASWAVNEDYRHTAFTLEILKASLLYFEDLFDIPYPLPKLDVLVIPTFEVAAMENFGLITMAARIGLTPPGSPNGIFDMALGTICHEVSHMWFGNLVTPAWWDDLFLKEGFATFLGNLRAANDLRPERRISQFFIAGRMARGLAADGKRNTHAVLDEDIQTLEELEGTWDAVCYSKGASIVAMIAAYVGERDFIRGARKFLSVPHSVANRQDFWKAITNARVDVVSFAQKWITTKGYPVVKIKATEHGFSLTQERFLQSGDLKEEEDTELWPVPLSAQVLKGDIERLVPAMFSEKSIDLALPRGSVFILNCNSLGMYRVRYPETMLKAIAQSASTPDSPISADARIGLLKDCFRLSEAGYYPPSVPLDFVSCLTQETEAWVLSTIRTLLTQRLTTWGCGSARAEKGIKALLRRLFSAQAEELGFDAKEGDSVMDPSRRRAVISGAVHGEDQTAIAELMRRFDHFLETGNMDGIPADLKIYLKSSDDMTQTLIAIAFAKVKVTYALDWSLGNLHVQHLNWTISAAFDNPQGNEAAIDWFFDNWANLESKLSRVTLKSLVKDCGASACDEKVMTKIEAFIQSLETGSGLETARSKAAALSRDLPAVLKWLDENGLVEA
ncbi:hypothetical protein QFC20_005951 [Naganishia adeliensis]|uniref:Uncharacterized protein n=1 Tax=Naganishia adeliensis TaxID=92952 RepID=A0ACC2VIP9_9TREE|nr:hypothetical protein QFC20_005951 [Naganishia adeliensis]